ncbi:MAG: glycosyltransferase family A protein [Gammaproteobacteria bacterium]|jgi:glycosyltransferase involved in cell wall biosynthesis
MPDRPRVSIGIPVYNGENYLADTLDSLLAQTLGDFEILIADNASTDGTREIARAYTKRDTRVRYFRHDRNIGAGPNHNFLLDHARAPYFKWAAHDDLYEPDYLAECVAVLDNDPAVVLAHSDGVMIDARGKTLHFDLFRQVFVDAAGHSLPKERIDICVSDRPEARFDDVLHKLVWCTAMYGVFRRDLADKLTLNRTFYGSDKVFLAEMALFGKFHHTAMPLFKKRCHDGMSARMSADARRRFMDTSGDAPSPYFALFRGYLNAALKVGPLEPSDRLQCLASVARKTVAASYWRRAEAA